VITPEESACIKVAACVCGKDGIISPEEETEMLRILTESIPAFSEEDLDRSLDEFFESTDQLEDYLKAINNPKLIKFTIYLSRSSASCDGLNPMENIALQKAIAFWGSDSNE
jgi:hypothetical protein